MCLLQGKSLSIICGALRWLEDCEQRERERVERVLAGCDDSTTDTHSAQEQESDDGRDLIIYMHYHIVCCTVCMSICW